MPKPIIPYYGAKNRMLKHILPLIPEHRIYLEPFFGSGAVFFAKEAAESEIINDRWNMAAIFYEQVKANFLLLKHRIEATPFSRNMHKYAAFIRDNPQFYSKLDIAHAFYIGVSQGFNSNFGSWAVDNYGKSLKAFQNRKQRYNRQVLARLENAQLESRDAVGLIASKKHLDGMFVYCDPPYIGTDCGMYGGYTEAHYTKLLDALSGISGKFLLSSFPNGILEAYVKKHKWQVLGFEKTKSAVKGKPGTPRTAKKVELLVANYRLGGGANVSKADS